MLKHRVAAVVPFFPHSSTASRWLLLGEPFSRRVYSNRDFEAVEALFDKMSGLFLDKLLELSARLEDVASTYRRTREQIAHPSRNNCKILFVPRARASG